jgi:4-hydroxy-4-methyl-2-oxoglutarate aldolase
MLTKAWGVYNQGKYNMDSTMTSDNEARHFTNTVSTGSRDRDDTTLFATMRAKLFSAVIGDILDVLGYRHQFLPPQIKPLEPNMILVGRAMPVLESDCFEPIAETSNSVIGKKPFGLMFEALDSLKEHDVYITTGSSPTYAQWGGLMTTRATHLKAAGAVLDGYSRDTNEVLASGFPVFSFGGYAQDQQVRGKVVDFNVPIELGNVRIAPGDIVFGDRDGVVIIPAAIGVEVVLRAIEKVETESRVATAIRGGMSTVEAFEKFGVM